MSGERMNMLGSDDEFWMSCKHVLSKSFNPFPPFMLKYVPRVH